MILCVDAGNTRLKWGLREGGQWLAQDAVDYPAFDTLTTRLPTPPARVVACNVAGAEVAASIAALAARWGLDVDWLRSSAAACGVRSGYDFPERLGADRWAALIGTRAAHAGPAVVVMAGTATTVDVLDDSGMFRGGLILPGLDLMRGALAQNTAGLPFANGRYREVPTNTDDAIVSGTLHATLGAIARMRANLGEEVLCVLSGGAAPALMPYLAAPSRHVKHLALEGLAVYAASSFS